MIIWGLYINVSSIVLSLKSPEIFIFYFIFSHWMTNFRTRNMKPNLVSRWVCHNFRINNIGAKIFYKMFMAVKVKRILYYWRKTLDTSTSFQPMLLLRLHLVFFFTWGSDISLLIILFYSVYTAPFIQNIIHISKNHGFKDQ